MRVPGEKTQADVLAVLKRHSSHLTAYDILGELRQANGKLAPQTVYRALNALIEQGLVHRFESLNAYVACRCSDHDQASILTVCDDCGTVDENVVPEVLAELSSIVSAKGFDPQRHVIEVHGLCQTCGTERVAK